MASAKIEGPLVGWCRAEFRAGRRGAFAIAIPSAKAGGRYLALDSNGQAYELASFARSAELSCYKPAEARKLNRTIAGSKTIHGSIAPVFGTTVICAFVEETNAICWQYSPQAKAFVKVGEWVT